MLAHACNLNTLKSWWRQEDQEFRTSLNQLHETLPLPKRKKDLV